MKKLFILLCLILFIRCDFKGGTGSPEKPPGEPPEELCLQTLNVGLSTTDYLGCWGDCPWNQDINCLAAVIYADEDCTEPLEAVSFLSPEIISNEVLLSATREWPDEGWLLFYVTDCNRTKWYIPDYYNYYLCGGPHKVWFYKHPCGDTLSPFYSGDNNIFDDSCVWGFR